MKRSLREKLFFQLHEGAAYQPRQALRLLIGLLLGSTVVLLGWRKVPEGPFGQAAFYWQLVVLTLTIALAYEANLRLHYLMLYRRLCRKDKEDGMRLLFFQLYVSFTLYFLVYIIGSLVYEAAPAPNWDFVPFKRSLDYSIWPMLGLSMALMISETIANARWDAEREREEAAETAANLNPSLDVDGILSQARESQWHAAFSFTRTDEDDDEWKLYLDEQDRREKLDNLCAYAEASPFSISDASALLDDSEAFAHMTGEPLESLFSWANACLTRGHLSYRKVGSKKKEVFEVTYGHKTLHLEVTGKEVIDFNRAIHLLAEVTAEHPRMYWLKALPRSDFHRFAYLDRNEWQVLVERLGLARFNAYFVPVTQHLKLYTRLGEWMYHVKFFWDLPKNRWGLPYFLDEE